MSNPGVLVLYEKNLGRGNMFRVEDNLGESIHLHYKNIRVDLTIKDLMELSSVCEKSIYDLVNVQGFDLNDYDNDFLLNNADKFLQLISVEEKIVNIRDLLYLDRKSNGILFRKKINKYSKKVIESHNDSQNHIPIIFNNDNIIIYGIDEVYDCYKKDPNGTIVVKNLVFKDGRYTVSKHPFLAYIFKWDKNRFINTLYCIASKFLKL